MTRLLPLFAVLAILALPACKNPDSGQDKKPASEPEKKAAEEQAAAEQEPAEEAEDPTVTRAKELAEQVAMVSVELIAAGEYGSVHDNADEILRSAVDRDQFIKMTKDVFAPLGDRKSIRLNSAKYSTRAPGGPDGVYVILRFESSFENKAEALETITMREAEPGFWRLAGYVIN